MKSKLEKEVIALNQGLVDREHYFIANDNGSYYVGILNNIVLNKKELKLKTAVCCKLAALTTVSYWQEIPMTWSCIVRTNSSPLIGDLDNRRDPIYSISGQNDVNIKIYKKRKKFILDLYDLIKEAPPLPHNI